MTLPIPSSIFFSLLGEGQSKLLLISCWGGHTLSKTWICLHMVYSIKCNCLVLYNTLKLQTRASKPHWLGLRATYYAKTNHAGAYYLGLVLEMVGIIRCVIQTNLITRLTSLVARSFVNQNNILKLGLCVVAHYRLNIGLAQSTNLLYILVSV